jgi:hypothetical protein
MVKPNLKPRELIFRIAIIYSFVFVLAGFAFILWPNVCPTGLLVGVSLLALICFIYALDFVGRVLTLAETGEPIAPSARAVTFLQLLFFPIGIWFLQPRVNRLYNGRDSGIPAKTRSR